MRPIDIAIERIREKIVEMSKSIEYIINEISKEVYRVESLSGYASRIRQLRAEIHSLVIEAIARYQPAASDLRYLMASLEISYGLFRFSRYALDIAYIIKNVQEQNETKCEMAGVKRMLPRVTEMMKDSIESFIKRDVEKANRIIKLDNEIDGEFSRILREALEKNDRCSFLDLIVCIYLERIADHSVYIASETLFMM
ncbi:MAG: PhoU domain-containing protein [Sulfolobales archaeon]